MRSFLPGRRGAGGAIMLVAIVGVGLFSARLARQQAPTPFQLFQRMMPVIRHPRCSNCHGGVDPTTCQQQSIDVSNCESGISTGTGGASGGGTKV